MPLSFPDAGKSTSGSEEQPAKSEKKRSNNWDSEWIPQSLSAAILPIIGFSAGAVTRELIAFRSVVEAA